MIPHSGRRGRVATRDQRLDIGFADMAGQVGRRLDSDGWNGRNERRLADPAGAQVSQIPSQDLRHVSELTRRNRLRPDREGIPDGRNVKGCCIVTQDRKQLSMQVPFVIADGGLAGATVAPHPIEKPVDMIVARRGRGLFPPRSGHALAGKGIRELHEHVTRCGRSLEPGGRIDEMRTCAGTVVVEKSPDHVIVDPFESVIRQVQPAMK